MDFSYLMTVSEGDKEFTNQFITTFKTNTQSLLGKMKSALDANDFEALRKSVHQLKPSLEMLQLKTHSLAIKIQENPSGATMENIREIEEECGRAVEEMNARFT